MLVLGCRRLVLPPVPVVRWCVMSCYCCGPDPSRGSGAESYTAVAAFNRKGSFKGKGVPLLSSHLLLCCVCKGKGVPYSPHTSRCVVRAPCCIGFFSLAVRHVVVVADPASLGLPSGPVYEQPKKREAPFAPGPDRGPRPRA